MIIIARGSRRNETDLDIELIDYLVGQYRQLDLVPALEAHCENCGDYLIRCPLCQSPYEPVEQNQQIVFQCPNHQDQIIQDHQTIQCECAAELEGTFSSDLRLFPGAEILKTLHEFLASMENQGYDGTFVIIANVLRLIPRRRQPANRYSLEDFRSWRLRAHLNQRHITEKGKQKYIRILNRIKEKCSRNGWHPTREICDACMNEKISPTRIRAGRRFACRGCSVMRSMKILMAYIKAAKLLTYATGMS